MIKRILMGILLGVCTISLSVFAEESASEKVGTDVVKVSTSEGDFWIRLFPQEAPRTVENFLNYVSKGFYNNLTFHRVVPDFVIQGGGYDLNFKLKKPAASIVNESWNGLSNVHGSVAMARTSGRNTANSQFFINLSDNTFLDNKVGNKKDDGDGYAVFGYVIDGMRVVKRISEVPTEMREGQEHVPVKPVVIYSIAMVSKEELPKKESKIPKALHPGL